ncbi:MAG: hypothetical protein HY318_11220 [Armatimonadetes bacterium]|nr:hypothetical protein [Armatimonadota bacterium]
MRYLRIISPTLALSFLLGRASPVMSADAESQPWQKLYTGAEATGDNVIALWQFQPGQETKDNSGHGHDLTLRGQARFVKDESFGAAIPDFTRAPEDALPTGPTFPSRGPGWCDSI